MPKRFALHSSTPEHKGAQYLIESRSEHALLAGLQGRSLHLMAEAFNWRSIMAWRFPLWNSFLSLALQWLSLPSLPVCWDSWFHPFRSDQFVWVFDLQSPALDHPLFLENTVTMHLNTSLQFPQPFLSFVYCGCFLRPFDHFPPLSAVFTFLTIWWPMATAKSCTVFLASGSFQG